MKSSSSSNNNNDQGELRDCGPPLRWRGSLRPVGGHGVMNPRQAVEPKHFHGQRTSGSWPRKRTATTKSFARIRRRKWSPEGSVRCHWHEATRDNRTAFRLPERPFYTSSVWTHWPLSTVALRRRPCPAPRPTCFDAAERKDVAGISTAAARWKRQ